MTAPVAGAVMGRPSKARQADQLVSANGLIEELRMEVRTLMVERDVVVVELTTLRTLLTYAFGVDSWHIVLGVRDRIASLATRLDRRGGVAL